MKATKRIISTILAICLIASLCCTAAFADDKDSASVIKDVQIQMSRQPAYGVSVKEATESISTGLGAPYFVDGDSIKWYKIDPVVNVGGGVVTEEEPKYEEVTEETFGCYQYEVEFTLKASSLNTAHVFADAEEITAKLDGAYTEVKSATSTECVIRGTFGVILAQNELVITVPAIAENGTADKEGFIIISENNGEPTSRYALDKDSVKWYKWDGVNESTKTEITGQQFEVGYDYDFSFVINFEEKIDSEMDLDIKLQYGDGNPAAGGCKLNDVDMHDTYCVVYGSMGTLINEPPVVGSDSEIVPAPDPNPVDPNPADPALNGAVVIGGVNVYMSNLPQVGMKIEDATQGIFACDGAVIVDSVSWLKKNPEFIALGTIDSDEGIYDDSGSSTESTYNNPWLIPVTEEDKVFDKGRYAVEIVLRAVKDVAIFADGVIATVNGMQASAVDVKGRDTCIVTFVFWELSDAVYLNIETAEPMVDGIASNMAYIANFNSNYYIDRNMVEWYRYVPEDENLENGEIATGTKFDFNYRYAIEFYIGVLSDDNAAEDERLHILINGREAEYELAKDKSMIKVFYVYDAYDMVNVDGDQVKSGETKAPAYKIMDGVVMGDLSGDKKVEMTDVVELQKIIAKLVNITNSADRLAADTNGDGRITMEDVTTMQKFIAKLIEKL